MEANTEAIVRLAWARVLGFADEALEVDEPTLLTRWDDTTVTVVTVFAHVLITGPDWLLEGIDRPTAESWVDQSALLRACDGHPARLIGQVTLSVTDDYAALPGLSAIPVSDEPSVVLDLERSCPPDDVAEVDLSSMAQAFVTLDDRDQPTAGAGYDEWQGFLAQVGVLTPPEHRRSGHGLRAAAIAVNDALDVGLVPQWRARVGHEASSRVATRLGFTPIGSQTTVRLQLP